jgi:hypothetical protein
MSSIVSRDEFIESIDQWVDINRGREMRFMPATLVDEKNTLKSSVDDLFKDKNNYIFKIIVGEPKKESVNNSGIIFDMCYDGKAFVYVNSHEKSNTKIAITMFLIGLDLSIKISSFIQFEHLDRMLISPCNFHNTHFNNFDESFEYFYESYRSISNIFSEIRDVVNTNPYTFFDRYNYLRDVEIFPGIRIELPLPDNNESMLINGMTENGSFFRVVANEDEGAKRVYFINETMEETIVLNTFELMFCSLFFGRKIEYFDRIGPVVLFSRLPTYVFIKSVVDNEHDFRLAVERDYGFVLPEDSHGD